MPLLTPHVPSGLIDLMKDLAKEVLRDKPENIYEFAIVHFEKLILERDGSLDKGYEEFLAFEAYFDGQQRFAVPSNCGYICQKPIKIQPIPQPKKSKADIMASFQAMESINEEDVLAQVPEGTSPYADEKYQNAIYVIQRYFRRYMARKKNPPITKSLSAFTAAIIIQRTMRRLFSNKIKLKKDKDSGPSSATAVKLVQDDMDNVSEAASYTSSSTIQMLADGQEGRENRLASGQNVYGDGDGVVGADDCNSMEFKEPTQDEEPPSSSATAVLADDDEEHSHFVVATTETDRKSITDENGITPPIAEKKPNNKSASTTDDTSTAHNIGILSTKIGSNYNHQNLPNTNNHTEIDRNRSGPNQINVSQLNIIPAGLSVPLNSPQSLLGATPDTLPATSPHLEETQETFAVHRIHEYANENDKNNDASSYFQGDGRIRKFDSDTGESLKIYDVYYHDVNDQEFSDSLNESTMEKDSLEPEELDADSLESNENVVHHMSDIVKRDARQDDGSLYGDKNDDEEGDEDFNDSAYNVQKFSEIERVPTYLYGIHPARTPVVERKNRNRNSEGAHKVPDDKKYLGAAVSGEMDGRHTEEKSEEESLESKGSTSEESSVTQIENSLVLREIQNKTSTENTQPVKDEEESPNSTDAIFNDGHSNSSTAEGQLMHVNELQHLTPTKENDVLNSDSKTKESYQNTMCEKLNLKPNDSPQSPKMLIELDEDSINRDETNLSEHEKEDKTSKDDSSKLEEESQGKRKPIEKANGLNLTELKEKSSLEEESTSFVAKSTNLVGPNLKEKPLLASETSASEKLIDSKMEMSTENIDDIPPNLEQSLGSNDLGKPTSEQLIVSETEVLTKSIENTTPKLEKSLTSKNLENPNLKDISPLDSVNTTSEKPLDCENIALTKSIEDANSKIEASSFQKENNKHYKHNKHISSLGDKILSTEEALRERTSLKSNQFQFDVKNSGDKLEEVSPKNEDGDKSYISDFVTNSEKISSSNETHLPTDHDLDHDKKMKPADQSEDSVYGENRVEQNPQVVDNVDKMIEQSENSKKSEQNLLKTDQDKKDSSSILKKPNFEDISNAPENPKLRHSLNSQASEDEKNKLSGHDQEIESQLQELQNLNDLLPILNTEDVINTIDLNALSKSQEYTIEKDEQLLKQSTDEETLKGVIKAAKVLKSSRIEEDEKSTFNASVNSNKTIAEGQIGTQKEDLLAKEERHTVCVESNGKSSERFPEIPGQKNEDVLTKILNNDEEVSNEEKVKTSANASTSDSLKDTHANVHISDDSVELKKTPSSVWAKPAKKSLDNLETGITNEQKEKVLNLDHAEPEVMSKSLGSSVDFHSFDISKPNKSIDGHFLNLTTDDSQEEGNSNNKKKISLKENNIDRSQKLLEKDSNEQQSLIEDKDVNEEKNNIREKANVSNDRFEDKEKIINLTDTEDPHDSENNSCSNDQVIDSDKISSNGSLNKCPAEIIKEEESVKPMSISASGVKEDIGNVILETEKSENIKFLGSSGSTEQREQLFEELIPKKLTPEKVQDSNITHKVMDLSSERIESEDSKDIHPDIGLIKNKSTDNMDSITQKSQVESKILKNEKLNEEVVSESKQIVEEKKPISEAISMQPRSPKTSYNSNKPDNDSIVIKENGKLLQECERNSTDTEIKSHTVSENPIQDVVASNENISQSKKVEQENSIPLASPDNLSCAGSSAETSADFSSIGKDLEFFEDTIKYLKNATEHLGGMDDMFDANKNSIGLSKDADVLNNSAVVIQSAFRGYQARKGLENKTHGKSEGKMDRKKRSLDDKNIYSKSNDEDRVNAAIQIQSAYRGHRVRKDLKEILNEKETERQIPGNVLSSPKEAETHIQSPSKNVLGSNLVKSQIPVAVIHPTKYSNSMAGQPEKASDVRTKNSHSISSLEIQESSTSKQSKDDSTTSVKTIHKNVKTSPQKMNISTRQKPLEEKPHVNNESLDDSKEQPSITQKRSIEKNDQTFICDTQDETIKMDQTNILGNRKLTKNHNSNGNRNKSNNLKTKTASTADLLQRSKGSKNARNQFERKGKSMSINGRAQNQESFDLETIKKELLSATFKSPPQSGSKKKTGARVRSGKQKSPVKYSKGTKIPQKSPSKIISQNNKQSNQTELQSSASTEMEKPVNTNENSDLLETFTVELDHDKNLEINLDCDTKEAKTNTKKTTLNKTYTVRSSLNEVEHLNSPKKTYDEKSEDLFESLKKDVYKLKSNLHEKSAVTIQKTFRGYRTRKNLSRDYKINTLRAFDNKPNASDQENIIEPSSKKDIQISLEKKEATKEGKPEEIQKYQKYKRDDSIPKTEKESSMPTEKQLELALDKAATKIQKTYRGYKTRKSYKAAKEKRDKFDTNEYTAEKITKKIGLAPEKGVNAQKLQQNIEISNEKSTNQNLEKSAITIQKQFRGYRSRKQLKSKKISKNLETEGEKEDSNLIDGVTKSKINSLNLHSKSDDDQDSEPSGIFESLQKSFEGYKNSVLDKSATTIQKHFRGYKIRKDINTKGIRSGTVKDTNEFDVKTQGIEAKRKSIHQLEGVKQAPGELGIDNSNESETEPVLTESEFKKGNEPIGLYRPTRDLDKSATTIQKNFRGYRARQHLKIDRKETDRDPKHTIISKTIKDGQIEEMSGEGINEDEIKKQSFFDSLRMEEFHNNETFRKSVTTIQKAFRGYKARKELLSKKTFSQTKEDTQENDKVEQKTVNPISAENLIQGKIEEHPQANDSIKESTHLAGIKQDGAELNSDKRTGTGKPGHVQQSAEDYTSPSKESRNIITKSDDDQDSEPSGIFESLQKSFEGYKNSVLDKSATTIQKHFRGYKIRKDINTKSIRSGIVKDTNEFDVKTQGIEAKRKSIHQLEGVKQAPGEFGINNFNKSETEPILTEGEYKKGDDAIGQYRSATDLDKSATTIQKNFRGYKTRQNLKINRKETDRDPKHTIISKNLKDGQIEDISGKSINEIKKQSIFDSLGMEEFHNNETFQKSATTIQKAFRDYEARKELPSKKTKQDTKENDKVERKIVNPISAENFVQQKIKEHPQANDSIKESSHLAGIKQDGAELNPDKRTGTGKPGHVQQSAEDYTSPSKKSRNIITSDITSNNSLSEDLVENLPPKSTFDKPATKSSSAGAVLENAASTIQKAYRDYHAKKNNNLSTKSYSNRTHREITPKETMENSDESSTFIGPDTSFDLSDVESVETKSEKAFNYDKVNSSEAHTPTNNSEEGISSTFAINVHPEDREVDSEYMSSPQKLRLKRSLIEPTAPPLDEILKNEEPTSSSPKLKWFVGDDPIIPSDSNSSKSSLTACSSVDPLISTNSKFNDLSSIDACGENLNSNLQLTPSINSAVVSTSSLLLTNNTELHNKNSLNNNSGIVSANEEENLKKEENNLKQVHQSEEISDKLKYDVEIAPHNVNSKEKLSNGSESTDAEAESKKNIEDKQEDTKEVATDLCKNCADGIHEGGICSEDLIKTTKSDQTELNPSDQIKQFVLMEELNHAQSNEANTESSVISSQKKENLSTVPFSGFDDARNEQLQSSNDCPAISLIPPSSEDDTSERESSLEVVRAKHKDDEIKNEKIDKGDNEDITEIKNEATEVTDKSFEEEENKQTEAQTKSIDTDTSTHITNIKLMEDIPTESVNGDLLIDSNEDRNDEEKTFSKIEKAGQKVSEPLQASNREKLDESINETKTVDNSSIDEKSKHSSNEIKDKDCSLFSFKEPLEDAFKTRPGEEFKREQHGFEDDFSDSKDMSEETSQENRISTVLEDKTQSMEKSEIVTPEKREETNKNGSTSKDPESKKGNNNELGESSSEAKGLEKKILQGEGSHELFEENEKVNDQEIAKETAKTESFDSKTERQCSAPLELNALENVAEENTKLHELTASDIIERVDNIDNKLNQQSLERKEAKEDGDQETQKDETVTKQVSKTLADKSSTKEEIVNAEVSSEEIKRTNDAIESKVTKEDEKNVDEDGTTSIITKNKEPVQTQEDIEIAAKLIESILSDPQAIELENESKGKLSYEEISTSKNQINLDPNENSKINKDPYIDDNNQPDPEVEAKLEKLIEDNLKPTDSIKNTVDPKDLPTSNSSQEVVEEPCVKTIIPPPPYLASSDPDESELESTTTKAESTTTTPGYDETSETDALDIPPSKPDVLDAMTEKLREPEEMVARMRQRRASEHKISIDSVTDQQAVFEEPICEPIKPMQKIQKSSSTDVEDEFVLQKLQRGDTTRESSAQSESVVYGDSTPQLTESEDTFNENLDLHSLHRMNTIAANRSTFKPPNHLFKSVTIDDTVKYIDPEKSTEESGSSFCMDDALSEDVRKKMMAYSVSEADSDYYDVGEQTNHAHDDFNISTALDNFPSTDTDTTIVSAATKIQAGARGFLTRRRIRRASMGTKASLTEAQNLSFGNDAIGKSLDQLAEEDGGRRQFNRQTGVNSLPSALEHSDEMLSPLGEDIGTITSAKHALIKIEDEKYNKVNPSSENDVNAWLEKPEDDSFPVVSNLGATVARRLTLQRGDALRNDSTPDDENGNGKQVDLAKNIPSSMGNVLVHEKTMVESTTTTTTRTTTERRNYSDAAVSNKKEKIKWFALRQNSMPVQIDSEIFRVLPKHMRKRIKSAEGEKPKRIRLPRD